MPSAGTYKLYFTAQQPATFFGLGVCNGPGHPPGGGPGVGADAHVSVFLIGTVESAAAAWTDGQDPPPYTRIVDHQLIEADNGAGNVWEMPVVVLRNGERIAVWTDLYGVTFNGHGIAQSTL